MREEATKTKEKKGRRKPTDETKNKTGGRKEKKEKKHPYCRTLCLE